MSKNMNTYTQEQMDDVIKRAEDAEAKNRELKEQVKVLEGKAEAYRTSIAWTCGIYDGEKI